jgi:hypothetical protein
MLVCQIGIECFVQINEANERNETHENNMYPIMATRQEPEEYIKPDNEMAIVIYSTLVTIGPTVHLAIILFYGRSVITNAREHF